MGSAPSALNHIHNLNVECGKPIDASDCNNFTEALEQVKTGRAQAANFRDELYASAEEPEPQVQSVFLPNTASTISANIGGTMTFLTHDFIPNVASGDRRHYIDASFLSNLPGFEGVLSDVGGLIPTNLKRMRVSPSLLNESDGELVLGKLRSPLSMQLWMSVLGQNYYYYATIDNVYVVASLPVPLYISANSILLDSTDAGLAQFLTSAIVAGVAMDKMLYPPRYQLHSWWGGQQAKPQLWQQQQVSERAASCERSPY